jgi:hypothetical protein
MWFLFFQIWLWLLVAFVAGWFAHWFFCCRGKRNEQNKANSRAQIVIENDQSPANEKTS